MNHHKYVCEACGAVFERSNPGNKVPRFCGKSCANQRTKQWVTFRCRQCKELVTKSLRNASSRTFCSRECYLTFQEKLSVKRNHTQLRKITNQQAVQMCWNLICDKIAERLERVTEEEYNEYK